MAAITQTAGSQAFATSNAPTIGTPSMAVGDAKIIFVALNSTTATVSSIDGDTTVGSWSKVASHADASGDDLEIWLGVVTGTGTGTATVHVSASVGTFLVSMGFSCAESPVTWGGDIAANSNASAASALSGNIAPLTVSGSNEVLLCIAAHNNKSISIAGGTGSTSASNGTTDFMSAAYLLAATGANTLTWSTSANAGNIVDTLSCAIIASQGPNSNPGLGVGQEYGNAQLGGRCSMTVAVMRKAFR